eukprot:ctg_777.g363
MRGCRRCTEPLRMRRTTSKARYVSVMFHGVPRPAHADSQCSGNECRVDHVRVRSAAQARLPWCHAVDARTARHADAPEGYTLLDTSRRLWKPMERRCDRSCTDAISREQIRFRAEPFESCAERAQRDHAVAYGVTCALWRTSPCAASVRHSVNMLAVAALIQHAIKQRRARNAKSADGADSNGGVSSADEKGVPAVRGFNETPEQVRWNTLAIYVAGATIPPVRPHVCRIRYHPVSVFAGLRLVGGRVWLTLAAADGHSGQPAGQHPVRFYGAQQRVVCHPHRALHQRRGCGGAVHRPVLPDGHHLVRAALRAPVALPSDTELGPLHRAVPRFRVPGHAAADAAVERGGARVQLLHDARLAHGSGDADRPGGGGVVVSRPARLARAPSRADGRGAAPAGAAAGPTGGQQQISADVPLAPAAGGSAARDAAHHFAAASGDPVDDQHHHLGDLQQSVRAGCRPLPPGRQSDRHLEGVCAATSRCGRRDARAYRGIDLLDTSPWPGARPHRQRLFGALHLVHARHTVRQYDRRAQCLALLCVYGLSRLHRGHRVHLVGGHFLQVHDPGRASDRAGARPALQPLLHGGGAGARDRPDRCRLGDPHRRYRWHRGAVSAEYRHLDLLPGRRYIPHQHLRTDQCARLLCGLCGVHFPHRCRRRLDILGLQLRARAAGL